MFPYQINPVRGGGEVLTAYRADHETPFYNANSNHPHYETIKQMLDNEDPEVWDMFNVGVGVAGRLRRITDRVSFDGTNILWDGDPVHSVLTEQLRRALESGESNYEAIAKFWEKLESNPNEHSRTQAYDFLAAHAFQITADGDVVGYKGVYQTDNGYESTRASHVAGLPSAYVDDEAVPEKSRVPNNIGTVVSMPRSEVVHDPAVSCERGLHVATRSYANGYGGAVLEVHVNPRDIVSVPTDAGGDKVRVCRYYVARVAVDNTGNTPVLKDQTPAWAGDVGYRV